eukprot:3226227-Rhodomonas_salina.3
MNQPIAIPQQTRKLCSSIPFPPPQTHHHVLLQAPKVLRATNHTQLRATLLLHKDYAAAVHQQILSKLFANSQSQNHSLSWPHVPQHSWRQQQQPVLGHSLRRPSTMRIVPLPQRRACCFRNAYLERCRLHCVGCVGGRAGRKNK